MVNGGNKFCTLSLDKLSLVEFTLLYLDALISPQRRHNITLCVRACVACVACVREGDTVRKREGGSEREVHPLVICQYFRFLQQTSKTETNFSCSTKRNINQCVSQLYQYLNYNNSIRPISIIKYCLAAEQQSSLSDAAWSTR